MPFPSRFFKNFIPLSSLPPHQRALYRRNAQAVDSNQSFRPSSMRKTSQSTPFINQLAVNHFAINQLAVNQPPIKQPPINQPPVSTSTQLRFVFYLIILFYFSSFFFQAQVTSPLIVNQPSLIAATQQCTLDQQRQTNMFQQLFLQLQQQQKQLSMYQQKQLIPIQQHASLSSQPPLPAFTIAAGATVHFHFGGPALH